MNSRFAIPPEARSGSSHRARVLEVYEVSGQVCHLTELTERGEICIIKSSTEMRGQSSYRPDQRLESRDLLFGEGRDNRLFE